MDEVYAMNRMRLCGKMETAKIVRVVKLVRNELWACHRLSGLW